MWGIWCVGSRVGPTSPSCTSGAAWLNGLSAPGRCECPDRNSATRWRSAGPASRPQGGPWAHQDDQPAESHGTQTCPSAHKPLAPSPPQSQWPRPAAGHSCGLSQPVSPLSHPVVPPGRTAPCSPPGRPTSAASWRATRPPREPAPADPDRLGSTAAVRPVGSGWGTGRGKRGWEAGTRPRSANVHFA